MELENIGARLKAFRLKTSTRMPAVEAATGIAKETLYKWEKGTKPSNLHQFFTLKSYLDKMENKQEEEDFNLETRKPHLLRLPFDPVKPAVSYTEGLLLAGTVILTNGEPEIIVERFNAPCLGKVEGAIRITDDSMLPKFVAGSWALISRLENIRIVSWGSYYYIIDTNRVGILRRIFQGETVNSIKLVCDNPQLEDYPAVELEWIRVKTIFKVMAGIRKLVM